ncbi:HaaA family cyclophane-containing RiPP peptide [Streptomyces sp. AK08-02]|uniref:HaaA family cyclophane-containing RiPP peptide n=1 Tax=Streptomyces sp. AK08-02 TaxID=3028654 RepID=UPI0029A4CF99|nr:HaaA family cyclophane-containing RiPP peptide [Streptomyces sp. AK08-02]MDX3749597.1 hypothetical protein [Streptomyces sp. AK08-02]
MPSRTPVPAPSSKVRPGGDAAQGNVVLDRVAARVRQRRAAEQAATNHVGDGSHGASLIWTWPL